MRHIRNNTDLGHLKMFSRNWQLQGIT
jgi:hypothetical protein